ncbi:hypothetical protein C8046_05990 [Serinibacter arcticus]|uniref:Protein-glutamine gamma-glutamyltransferase-like C-terminal domain-containing protein n=1 Tax=Serinibacter arcticus TaxID=1655435 RepID=A0A2U1ZTK8_9MICO|nr:DUF4129 domain-containing protein [Serinibacter arcticus]PWD50280.1 hypothetical protein C8046_05990 [Serinibacter arcticus]
MAGREARRTAADRGADRGALGPGRAPSRAFLPGALAGGVLLLAVLGAGLRGTWDADPPPADTPPPGTPPSPDLTPPESATLEPAEPIEPVEPVTSTAPEWVTDALTALAVAFVVVLVILGVRWLWAYLAARRTTRLEAADPGATSLAEDTEVIEPPDLAPALERAGRALRTGEAPGDAIVAAWVALEETAAASGAARSPSDTPTEFTTALLDRTAADPDAVARLRETYRAARFGSHRPTDADVAAAADALDRIEATWEGR